jgi:hypothetical protein
LRARRLALPTLLIVFSLALVACGGGGGSEEEDQVVASITRVMAGNDPTACKKLQTQAFMEQNAQIKGKEAVKACEEEAAKDKSKGKKPQSVVVSEVEVDRSQASADVAFSEGGFEGQTVAISLTKSGGQWKLDKAEGFVKFDKAKLIAQFEAKLKDPASKIKKSTTECFVKGLEKKSKSEMEDLVLGGSSEPTTKLLESCS